VVLSVQGRRFAERVIGREDKTVLAGKVLLATAGGVLSGPVGIGKSAVTVTVTGSALPWSGAMVG
jgi:hypothetical protein